MQVVSGVHIVPPTSNLHMTHSVEPDAGGILATVPPVVTGDSSVTIIVPYNRSSMAMPSYNSSAMYEDNALPVYVDYIGNIMPILDRQSIATNWSLTPHPLTGQVRYVPYNSANIPTIPYIMGVGSSLMPRPIRGQPSLSEITPETQPELSGDSVSQIGANIRQTPSTVATSYITSSTSRQSILPIGSLSEPVRSVTG